MRLSTLDADGGLFGLGEEMDYSQGLPTPVSGLGQIPEGMTDRSFLVWGLATGAVQIGLSYFAISCGSKQKPVLKTASYVLGGLLALGAVGSIAFGLGGRKLAEKAAALNK